MKYIMNVLFGLCLLIGINMSNSAYSIGILSQDPPENTWDPQFESIDFYRKPNSNNNYENIINFVFGDFGHFLEDVSTFSILEDLPHFFYFDFGGNFGHILEDVSFPF